MNAKAILAIANEAIAMLPHGATLALRVRLAQATAATSKTAGKCVLCNETVSADSAIDGFLGKKLKAGPAHFRCADMYRRNAAEFSAWCDTANAKFARQFDLTAMAVCACGHPAHQHEKDELENLLDCQVYESAFEDAKKCPCDHFHYEIADDESVAA